jgi:hypothetical protein
MQKLPMLAVNILLVLFAANADAQSSGYSKNGADQNAQQVSIVQLIANPQAYDGKKVRLVGFLQLEFEGNGLYLHKEDYEHEITENALWVDAPPDLRKEQRDAVNTQYVICEGTFKASGHGHMGIFSGELSDVTRIEASPSRRVLQHLIEKH